MKQNTWKKKYIEKLIISFKYFFRLIGAKNTRNLLSIAKREDRKKIQGLILFKRLSRRISRYSKTNLEHSPEFPLLSYTEKYVSQPGFRFCLKNARAAGPTPAIIDANYNVVKESSQDWGKEGFQLGIMKTLCLPQERKLKGDSFMAACLGGETYFHWMTDVLPMLLWENKFGERLSNYEHFLSHSNLKNFHWETFHQLSIQISKIRPLNKKTLYLCEKITAHTPHHDVGRPPEKILRAVASVFLSNKKNICRTPKKLVILRKKGLSRSLSDGERITNELKKRGFCEYDPGIHSIANQALTFRGARIIVAAHGAALTNIIFCRPGTILVELFSAKYTNPCYLHIAQQLGIRHVSVVDNKNTTGDESQQLWAASEPIHVSLGQVKAVLKKIGL